jgi:hypothetical protein
VAVLEPDDVHHDRVLTRLPHHGAVHSACPAVSDPDHPSKSRLLLGDHEELPLTVMDVATLRLENPEFAYLSAYSTACTEGALAGRGGPPRPDLQLAGYRNDIATCGRSRTARPSAFATGVYDMIGQPGSAATAAALHIATSRLRNATSILRRSDRVRPRGP